VYIAKAVQRLDPVRLMLYQSIIGSAGFSSSASHRGRSAHPLDAGLVLSIVFQARSSAASTFS
jgi:hypothetical protein